jgi:hypothetical protein
MNYEELWAKAVKAGQDAVKACTPVPMVVQEVDLFDTPIPGSRPEFVADGVCGFAWVKVRPANSPFAKWLKTVPRTDEYLEPHKDDYAGGITIWVTVGNQSMQRKEAYAEAMAKVLSDNGLNAHAETRLD